MNPINAVPLSAFRPAAVAHRPYHPPNPLDSLTPRQQLDLVHVIETGGLAAAREWTHLEYGVEAKPHEVALFYAWHQLRPRLQETTLLVAACVNTLDAVPLAKTDDESVSLNASARLEMQALLGPAPIPPLELRKTSQRDRLLVLAACKLALLKTQIDLAQAANKKLRRRRPSVAEQEAHMREVFGFVNQPQGERFVPLTPKFPSSTENMFDP